MLEYTKKDWLIRIAQAPSVKSEAKTTYAIFKIPIMQAPSGSFEGIMRYGGTRFFQRTTARSRAVAHRRCALVSWVCASEFGCAGPSRSQKTGNELQSGSPKWPGNGEEGHWCLDTPILVVYCTLSPRMA